MRTIGIDDGPFQAGNGRSQRALVLGVLFRDLRISTVRAGLVRVDGTDSNRVLASMLRPLRFDVTLISGISLGGFNLVDIHKLACDTHRPVIAVIGERPDNDAVRRALRDHFDDWKVRWRIVLEAGKLYWCKPLQNEPRLYFEIRGGSSRFARKVIKATAAISRLPEPVRVAAILARGLSSAMETSLP